MVTLTQSFLGSYSGGILFISTEVRVARIVNLQVQTKSTDAPISVSRIWIALALRTIATLTSTKSAN